MTSEQLEQMLAALPTRRLPAEAETGLLTRLQLAQRPGGLRRPIALWHGIAAAIAGLAIGLATHSLRPLPSGAEAGPVRIAVETDWFVKESWPTPGLDITNWSPLVGLGGT